MGEFSISHLILIAIIFLVFFGPSRLPALGQSIGKAIRGFKDGLNEIETEAKDVKDTKTEQIHQAQNQSESSTQSQPNQQKQNTNQNS